MYHTAAFTGSIALTSTKQPVPALNDSVLRIGPSNGFVLQDAMMLIGAKAGGVGMANPNLQAPKLLQFRPWFITPFDIVLAATNPDLTCIVPHRAFTFREQEELVAQSDNGNAGAQQQCIVVHLATQIDVPPQGEILTLTGSSVTAAVANQWSLVAFTLDQALPTGVYAMLASEHQSANAIAHRATFFGQFYRPGMTSTTAFNNRQAYNFPWLTFGTMGQFSNVSLFNMEVLCGAADAAHTFRWRCIKIK